MLLQMKSPEDRLAEAIRDIVGQSKGVSYKHDATGTPTTTYAHGPGGLFTYPGVNPDVFSAMIGIEAGLVGLLPKYASVETNPIFETITGVQDDVGNEPSAECDPAIVAGLLKACKLTSVFGRYRRQTRELYLNRLGQRVNNSDPMNLRLMNTPMGNDQMLAPDMIPGAGTEILNNEVLKVLFEFGVSVNRLLARQIWDGNPTNNNGEGYKELTGVNLLIGTGKVDAETGVACPAMDSDIKNFNYSRVDDLTGTNDIVEVVTYLYRTRRSLARRAGLMPVEWVFAMREELFYEVSAMWPCSYLTYRCAFRTDDGTVTYNVSSADAINFRDDMRQNQYLLIDGIRVPVVFDDGINEQVQGDNGNIAAGGFASDIYLIPLTVLGGTPVTYMEYFDHGNASITTALTTGRLGGQVWTTNNGAWIWTAERSRLCVFWEGKVEPRLIMRTPYLAGRIQNVEYSPLQHTRTAFPDDPYFVNGGVTSRVGPSLHSEWNLP